MVYKWTSMIHTGMSGIRHKQLRSYDAPLVKSDAYIGPLKDSYYYCVELLLSLVEGLTACM